MDAKAHGLTLARAAAEARGSSSPSNAASVLKNSATVVAQTRAELTLEIMGYGGLGWGGEGFTQEQIDAVRGWLSGKANCKRARTTMPPHCRVRNRGCRRRWSLLIR
jgi:hypothetical protein